MKHFVPPLLAAVLAGCTQWTGAAAQPETPWEAGTVAHAMCRLGFTAIPLTEMPTGHHLVDARLNGRPGTFVLDTGANATVLHAPYAGDFGLGTRATAQGGAIGLGGATTASQYRIDSLTIGPVETRQRHVLTLDLGQIATMLAPLAGRPVHGIVGQDLLGAHRAVIDVRQSVVYMMAEDADPAPVPADRCAPPG